MNRFFKPHGNLASLDPKSNRTCWSKKSSRWRNDKVRLQSFLQRRLGNFKWWLGRKWGKLLDGWCFLLGLFRFLVLFLKGKIVFLILIATDVWNFTKWKRELRQPQLVTSWCFQIICFHPHRKKYYDPIWLPHIFQIGWFKFPLCLAVFQWFRCQILGGSKRRIHTAGRMAHVALEANVALEINGWMLEGDPFLL